MYAKKPAYTWHRVKFAIMPAHVGAYFSLSTSLFWLSESQHAIYAIYDRNRLILQKTFDFQNQYYQY